MCYVHGQIPYSEYNHYSLQTYINKIKKNTTNDNIIGVIVNSIACLKLSQLWQIYAHLYLGVRFCLK